MDPDDIIPLGDHTPMLADDSVLDTIMGQYGMDTKTRTQWENAFMMAQAALITKDRRMIKLKQDLAIAADNELSPRLRDRVTCMIYGESGTGKELCARILHGKRRGAFVSVNCSAIPRELFEKEFFGSKKGAFTDSKTDEPGHFAAAEDGTLFLDEIGDIPIELQGKFLRVLQSREITRVGDTKPRRVNCQVVSATNMNLPEMVKNRSFRIDLFQRLTVVEFTTVPLRERPDDIPLILQDFRMKNDLEQDSEVPPIEVYADGNVRALENWAIRKALSL